MYARFVVRPNNSVRSFPHSIVTIMRFIWFSHCPAVISSKEHEHSKSSIHQQMPYVLILENSKIYIKT
jgi:hypothetical protein